MFAVIHNAGLSGVYAMLVVIDAKTRIRGAVVNQVVVADAAETDLVFDEFTKLILRQLGNDTRAKPQQGDTGSHIQFRTACALLKHVTARKALVVVRGQTEHNFAKHQGVKAFSFRRNIHKYTALSK